MAISSEKFLSLVPTEDRDSASHRTVTLWYHIYLYIEEHGSADTVDDDDFVASLKSGRSMTTKTLARHLRRMNAMRIIEGRILVRQGTDLITNMLCMPFGGLPSRFIRYVLPGNKAPCELRRATKVRSEFTKALDSPEFIKEFERSGFTAPESPFK